MLTGTSWMGIPLVRREFKGPGFSAFDAIKFSNFGGIGRLAREQTGSGQEKVR
jgi:hypothetical protein